MKFDEVIPLAKITLISLSTGHFHTALAQKNLGTGHTSICDMPAYKTIGFMRQNQFSIQDKWHVLLGIPPIVRVGFIIRAASNFITGNIVDVDSDINSFSSIAVWSIYKKHFVGSDQTLGWI